MHCNFVNGEQFPKMHIAMQEQNKAQVYLQHGYKNADYLYKVCRKFIEYISYGFIFKLYIT